MTDIFPGATLRQLVEWGFPKGATRPAPAASQGFSVIHVTGNPGNPIATAEGEVGWRINDPADQNSATFFVNRDGSVVQALGDPLAMAPWANGDTQNPDMSNPRIAACIKAGVNPNYRTIVAIENVGRPTDLPITDAQVETNARIIARYHSAAGVPISRESVVGHYQINATNRPNCPAIDKSVIDRIVARAQAIVAPPEENMIAVPTTTFPAGATVTFAAGTTYDLFNLNENTGAVTRRKYAGTGTTFPALAKVRIGGDADHEAIAYRQKDGSVSFISGWGPQPPVQLPATLTAEDVRRAAAEAVAALNKNLDVWVSKRPIQ